MGGAAEPRDDGFVLRVRLTPNAGDDRLEGAGRDDAGEDYLKIKVRAVPEKGKANKAAIALLAKALDCPKSAIRLESGAKARLKRFHIAAPDSLNAARKLLEAGS